MKKPIIFIAVATFFLLAAATGYAQTDTLDAQNAASVSGKDQKAINAIQKNIDRRDKKLERAERKIKKNEKQLRRAEKKAERQRRKKERQVKALEKKQRKMEESNAQPAENWPASGLVSKISTTFTIVKGN